MSVQTPSNSLHQVTIVAHRGLHEKLPENSIVSFSAARSAGFAWIEFDVWSSADGWPVIIHDETLDRTTEAKGPVRSMMAKELGQVRLKGASGWLRKWRLPVGLPGGPALIEVKPTDSRELVATVIKSARQSEYEWMIQSFDSRNLVHAWSIDANVPAALLVEDAGDLDRAIEDRWPAIHARHDLLNEAVVTRLRSGGASVGAWTVNEYDDIVRIAMLRPDRIISDRPETVRLVLSSLAVAGICEAPGPEPKGPNLRLDAT